MIRWRFIGTRILIIAAVLIVLRVGLGPVTEYLTVKGLQSATGARVEIGATRVSLFPPSIQFRHFHVADPRDEKEMRDAFRADSIELKLDGDALLSRRWVADSAKVSGLQIGAERSTSGHFAHQPEEEDLEDSPSDTSFNPLFTLLSSLTGQLQRQSSDVVNELETVTTSRRIKSRWEQEYASLQQRSKTLENRIKEFRDTVKAIDNPLRDWQNVDRTFAIANEARAELKAVRDVIDALPKRLDNDFAALENAKQSDLKRIDDLVPGDLSQSKNFGADLIRESIRSQISEIRDYWEGGRQIANYTVVAPEVERERGITIDLLGDQRRPSVLVKRCEVSGLMRASGEAYTLAGIVENVTTTPELLAAPFRARLNLEGPRTIKVDYIRDRRQQSDIDLLTLHMPNMESQNLSIGKADQAKLSFSGGEQEIWIQIRTEGDSIQGRMAIRHSGVHVDAQVHPKLEGTPAITTLKQNLAQIDRVDIDTQFKGTWESMQLDLKTNLTGLINHAVQEAITSQVAASKAELAENVRSVHQEQTLKLREWLNQQESKAQKLLAHADGLVAQLNQKVLGDVDSSEITVGRMKGFLESKLR